MKPDLCIHNNFPDQCLLCHPDDAEPFAAMMLREQRMAAKLHESGKRPCEMTSEQWQDLADWASGRGD